MEENTLSQCPGRLEISSRCSLPKIPGRTYSTLNQNNSVLPLTARRSWQQELEEAQKALNEHKAKGEEQTNLWRRLEREVKEAKVSKPLPSLGFDGVHAEYR